MLALYILLTAVFILLVKYLRDFYNYRKRMNQFPGDDTHPLLGNLHTYPGFKENGLRYEYDLAEKYKYFNRFWSGPFDCQLFAYHPEVVKEILKKSIKPRSSGLIPTDTDMGVPWLGESLVMTNGPRWHQHRRLLTPSFHFDILKSYIKIYNSCADIILSNFLECSKSKVSFDLNPMLSKYTFDIILRCAYSLQSGIQTKAEPDEFIETVNELGSLWMKRFLNPLHVITFFYKHLTSDGKRFYQLCDIAHQKSETIIKQRQEEIKTNPSLASNQKPRDFLDTLIRAKDNDGSGLSFEDIRSEVDTFLFAGFDTTKTGTMWTLMSLAQHPQYQDQIYTEVKDVLGDREEVTWDDLSKLQFTGQCIKEAMRQKGAVPAISRVTTEDIHFQGHHIHAGTTIFLQLWAMHNNPHVWDDPLEFKPERFSPEGVSKMDAFQFIPFSAGSRNCIGQSFAMHEMKLTVARVVQRFRLAVDKKKPVLREIGLVMKAEHGAFVYATPREE